MYTMQRDGAMAFENHGARPLHLSSIDPPTLKPRPYDISKSAGYDDGHAISFLSGVSNKDFEQPRALWQRVFTEEDRQLSIKELSGHMSNSHDKQSITQAVNIFWLVDEQLGDALAQNLKLDSGSWQKPLKDLNFIGSHNFESNKDALTMLETYKSNQQKAAEKAGDLATAVKEGASFVAQKATEAWNGHGKDGARVNVNGVNGVNGH